MIRVALTGGAGSGKSLVCRFFQELGAGTISLDELAREAVSPDGALFSKIVGHFGKAVIGRDGGLDRRQLRRLIVKDPKAKGLLENITHPEIFRLLERDLKAIGEHRPNAVVVVEVPLLVETGSQDRFDVIVLVEADEASQLQRIMERDGCSLKEAEDLLAVQGSIEEKKRYADFVIENKGGTEGLKNRVREVYSEILPAS